MFRLRSSMLRGVSGAIVAGDFYQRTDLVKVAEQLNREPPGAAR